MKSDWSLHGYEHDVEDPLFDQLTDEGAEPAEAVLMMEVDGVDPERRPARSGSEWGRIVRVIG